MDSLIEKMGYLDYRDALAANKYILEAREKGDFHQKARAKLLAVAYARMSKLKREQIEQQANLKAKQSKVAVDKEEEKLKLVYKEDGVYEHVYDKLHEEVVYDETKEIEHLRALHEDFDSYYDKENMKTKLSTDWFDPAEIDKDDEMIFSEDFTDEGDEFTYKRYKVSHW